MQRTRILASVLALLLVLTLSTPSSADLSATGLVPSWAHPAPQGNSILDLVFLSADVGFGVGLEGSVVHTGDGGETWELRSNIAIFDRDLYGVYAADESHLIAVGEAPGIFRSTDGGVTWAEVPNSSTGTLLHLTHSGDGRLDAAGHDGQVLRSADGGATWSDIGPGIGTIESQWWASASEGWVVGMNVAHHTTDGGANWSQFLDFAFFGYREVVFYDALEGEVLDDSFSWRTTDGGATWEFAEGLLLPLYPKKTIDLGGLHRLRITNTEGAELWETLDGGETWTRIFFQSTVGMLDLERDPSGRIHCSSDVGDLFWSDDQGQTLNNGAARSDVSPARIGGFSSTPSGVLHAATQPASLFTPTSALRSTDGGRTWEPTHPAPPRWTRYTWPTETVGLGVSRAELYRSEDNGETWTLANTLTTGSYSAITPIEGWVYAGTSDPDTGEGSLLLSTDLGLSWTEVSAGLPARFSPMFLQFLSGETGFVAGMLRQGTDVPRIYFTENAGGSWTQVPTPTNDLIAASHWFGTETGLVQSSGTNPRMFRTTDRGQTWTVVGSERITRLAFLGDIGIGIPSFSTEVHYSLDAGVTWQGTTTPMAKEPLSVYATAGEFLIGGDGTAIIRLGDEDVAGLGDGWFDNDLVTSTIGLTLSYAGSHPVRGAVSFSLFLPAPGVVDVDVIDPAGRRVASLAHGFRSAGEFPLHWDGRTESAEAAPSGVYFVRAHSGEGTTDVLRVVRVE